MTPALTSLNRAISKILRRAEQRYGLAFFEVDQR
jgi:hypothetical protein